MKDNFDKILSDKIKEVTENRDLPYNPKHWEMLVAKKNKKKRRAFILWRLAAILVLFFIAGSLVTFFINDKGSEDQLDPQLIIDAKNDSLRKNNLMEDERIIITKNAIDSTTKMDSRVTQIDSVTKTTKFKTKSIVPFETLKTGNENRITQNRQKTENKKTTLLADKGIVLKDSIKGSEIISGDDLLLENEKLAQNVSVGKRDMLSKNNGIANLEDKFKNDSLTIKKELIAALEEDNVPKERQRKPVKIGLNVSPLFNYSTESENSTIGFAGGVSVEIPISGKFDIYTGVMYVNQKFNLHEESTYLADEVSAKGEDQLIAEEATVIGIEIPIAIKYNFSIAQKDVFVTAGVSATSNFKENIEADYIVSSRTQSSKEDTFGNSIVQYELVQTSTKVVTSNGSNNFNFASILNLSIGMEVPINKARQSIIVEPYFKYSLAPVTQKKIDFSSAGIYLRYNFAFKRN